MTALAAALAAVLRNPDPDRLEALQEALLLHQAAAPAEQVAVVSEALALAGDFYRYLVDLQARLTARQFSELASWLDMAAVGAVALEHLVSNPGGGWVELVAAGLSEALMAVASRQYVRAWSVELKGIDLQARWRLRESLWRLSLSMQPELSPAERMAAVQRLVAPLADPTLPSAGRLLLLARLYQVALTVQVNRLIQQRTDWT